MDADKILFYNVTVDSCITCKFNKIVALDSIRTPDLFQKKNVLPYEVTLLPKMIEYKILDIL